MKNEKVITYKTHWKNYFGGYIKAYALIPVFGVGLFLLKRLNTKIEGNSVRIFDDRVEYSKGSLLISQLESVQLIATDHQKKHGLMDVILSTESTKVIIPGIPKQDADGLEDVLLLAILAEKKRRAMAAHAKGDYADEFKLGGLEHMNSLVGLWQQGLISDADFEIEQRKFKK